MVKKYRVALAEEEQQELKGLVGRGRAAAYRQTHARILLLCDENQANGSMKDEEIARALKVGKPPRWNGCAAAVWRRVRRGPWDARSSLTAAPRSWTAMMKPS